MLRDRSVLGWEVIAVTIANAIAPRLGLVVVIGKLFTVVVRIAAVSNIDLIQNCSHDWCVCAVEPHESLLSEIAGGAATIHNEDDSIDRPREQDGVAHRQNRTGVDQDIVILRLKSFEQIAHGLRTEQGARIWGRRSATDER